MTPNERRLIDVLKKMQEVTKVLGKGVGNITTPDGFFKLWNDAEVEADKLIHLFDPPVQTEFNYGEPNGQFDSFADWVATATRKIGGKNSLCVDTQGRVCKQGSDFMRAADEKTFPINFYHGKGGQSEAEQERNKKAMDQPFLGVNRKFFD